MHEVTTRVVCRCLALRLACSIARPRACPTRDAMWILDTMRRACRHRSPYAMWSCRVSATYGIRLGREVRLQSEISLRIHAAAGAEQLATGQSDFGGVRNIPSAAPERAHAVTEACNDVRAAGVAMDGRVPVFSAHQMGTARMGAEPSVSVVDLNGESWEVKNLYVADASLFPTSSGSNPMMTTLSLSHVVAQRLKRTLALKQIAVPAVAKL